MPTSCHVSSLGAIITEMFSFSSHKKIDSLNLIIDIQSSVVRGALILVKSDATPRVLWTSSSDIAYRPDGGSSYLVSSALQAIETISSSAHVFIHDAHAHEAIPNHITGIHCVLSSPWIVSCARTVVQQFEKDTRIHSAHIHDIIAAERLRAVAKDGDAMVSVEEKIFDVRLNGYSVFLWKDVVARTLEVSFAVSMASTDTIKHFTEACKKSGFHGRVDFHSSLLLQQIGVGIIMPVHDSYILIHVHGELTDIVVANNQSCILFGSYPRGIRTVVRNITEKLSISDSAAESLLTLYENKQIDSQHGLRDIESVHTVGVDWNKDGDEVLALIPKNYTPVQAIISSRSHEIFFKNEFESLHQHIVTEVLTTDTLFTHIKFDPQTEQLRLTALYMIAIQHLEILR